MTKTFLPLLLLMATIASVDAQIAEPVARIGYDARQGRLVGMAGPVEVKGNATTIPGPYGPALRLDGNTTLIATEAWPRLTSGEPWTLTAWIKLDAWPWNEAPIVDQKTQGGALFFGVDALGHLVAQRRTGAAITRLVSNQAIPLRTWTLVSLSWDGEHPRFTINGEDAAGATIPAAEGVAIAPAEALTVPLLIGQVRTPSFPYPANAIHPHLPVRFTLDGAVDAIALYDRRLEPRALKALMQGIDRRMLAPGAPPPLPRWTGGAGPFGAFQTSLRYDPAWDNARRMGAGGDVVVRFPQAPIQLVFWQGLNYIPAWVTENGHWYTDQFMEIYGPRCPGDDCEPMSDKQARYSHVAILENTPARAVIHWRYALSEVERYRIAEAFTPGEWGAWGDEYWTVYPDGSAVRKQVLWTDNPAPAGTEFQESIVVLGAGQRPEDAIHPDAVTLANLKGESKTFSWGARTAAGYARPNGPDRFGGIADPIVQRINLKSAWKPFTIVGAGPMRAEGYNGEPSMSQFEWWNHWPVSQLRSSGRPAVTADRPGHTSLTHLFWPIAERTPHYTVKILQDGLTTGSAASLATRARAFVSPPTAHVAGARSVRFDQAQKAFVVEGAASGRAITLTIEASPDRPLVNPAIVVPGWTGTASVAVTGARSGVPQLGYVDRLEGRTLVAYLPMTAVGQVTIKLTQDQ